METIDHAIDYSALPEWARDGMRRYVEQHVETGGGLRACLENDLAMAVGRIWRRSPESAEDLCTVALWLYNEAPSPCWGSRETVAAWLAAKPVTSTDDEPPARSKREEAAG